MIYEYTCPICKEKHDVTKSVEELQRKEECPKCGTMMIKMFTTPYIMGDTSVKNQ